MRLPELSPLQWALLVSAAFHGALLTVRFVDPEAFNRVFSDTPLEVILVNAKSNEVPLKAQAIAQAHLAGGGELEKGRATSPLPPMQTVQIGDAVDGAMRVELPQPSPFEPAGDPQRFMQDRLGEILRSMDKRMPTGQQFVGNHTNGV